MADKPSAKPQIIILYKDKNDAVFAYDSAYDDRQAEEAIERCEDKHGFDSFPKAVEGLQA